ncbi:retinol dehydrogenase 12 [Basidiobolus meristosporus CBS 931.73]|uniref:Retinol dehydrogenase 12 n=1 Tax=Basidiobolus meristosporus CBS 931.73 TaxID=1314790 RepID=A0A1Y1Y4H5_9FUNG|nr:retinol dehydrogenase 12 [Basidiobolus meristosporus CBS 931.73]|eukprot:ORX92805.1 retinol dehydrogenase 12 [Basidiobolus meristosporus CBS 931.73]
MPILEALRFAIGELPALVRDRWIHVDYAPSERLDSKVVIVTGSNCGVGYETAKCFYRLGARVILACRSRERGEKAVQDILRECKDSERSVSMKPQVPEGPVGTVEFMELDLASFQSVRQFAHNFLALNIPLHILVNNAGLSGVPGKTVDNFEITVGVNHLGHYLLTRLLLKKLDESAPARIVNVASEGHYYPAAIDLDSFQKEYKGLDLISCYCQSKLANVLFTRELAKRLEGHQINVYAPHPGGVASEIYREYPDFAVGILKKFMLDNQQGASCSLFCATAKETANDTGKYYEFCKLKEPSSAAQDDDAASRLWDKSAEWTGVSTELWA